MNKPQDDSRYVVALYDDPDDDRWACLDLESDRNEWTLVGSRNFSVGMEMPHWLAVAVAAQMKATGWKDVRVKKMEYDQ
jgi:hypothetical protein